MPPRASGEGARLHTNATLNNVRSMFDGLYVVSSCFILYDGLQTDSMRCFPSIYACMMIVDTLETISMVQIAP